MQLEIKKVIIQGIYGDKEITLTFENADEAETILKNRNSLNIRNAQEGEGEVQIDILSHNHDGREKDIKDSRAVSGPEGENKAEQEKEIREADRKES